MKKLNINTDPVWHPESTGKNWYSGLSFLLNDERDLPILLAIIKMSIFLALALLFFSNYDGKYWWVLAALFFTVFHIRYHGTFVLSLHCSSHRIFFKTKYKFLNLFFPNVLGLFFGQSPKSYYYHHIFMHHLEGNLTSDLSSTMSYQRDDYRDFLVYYFAFMTKGIIDLGQYFFSKKKAMIGLKIYFGELLLLLVALIVSWWNLEMGLLFIVFPFILSRLMLPMGNWAQHAFIDSTHPDNNYVNSITCINNPYNHICWNDGYHTQHHIRPGKHWTEYPTEFRNHLDAYIEEKAIVFDGLDYFQIFILLMRKNYKKLADNFVNIGDTYKDETEVIQMLKSRLKKITTARIPN